MVPGERRWNPDLTPCCAKHLIKVGTQCMMSTTNFAPFVQLTVEFLSFLIITGANVNYTSSTSYTRGVSCLQYQLSATQAWGLVQWNLECWQCFGLMPTTGKLKGHGYAATFLFLPPISWLQSACFTTEWLIRKLLWYNRGFSSVLYGCDFGLLLEGRMIAACTRDG